MPKIRKYKNKDGKIIQLEEEPSEETEQRKTKKIHKKKKKPKNMITKDGKKVKVIDNEEEPSSR